MDKVVKIFQSLTTSATIQIKIDAKPDHKFFKTKAGGKKSRRLAIFRGEDSLSGIVELNIKQNQQLQHYGVRVLLIGHLQIYEDSSLSTEFLSLSKQLLPAGTLRAKSTLKFKFQNFDKEYQSFYGVCGQVRYSIRASIILDKYLPNITKEIPFAVFKYQSASKYQNLSPVKMDIGSQGRVNIILDIEKNCYNLKDCIKGVVKFTEVKITIKNMQLWLVRKEKLGSQKYVQNDTQTMIQYEIMDGSPETGDEIPIRLYLNGVYGLGPSFISLHNRLTVTYLLKLVIVDAIGKKYIKQSPITLYRLLKQ